MDERPTADPTPPTPAGAAKTPAPCWLYTIRPFRDVDAREVGELIAATYSRFNLSFAAPGDLAKLLGPFQHAGSAEPVHRDAIAQVLRAPMVYVAEGGGDIVGVLRGRKERLASLFVRADHQRRGIGRRLVECFEQESLRQGVGVIRVAATLYAIPFYTALGYRKTTGIRNGWSFQGRGLRYQPMKKVLASTGSGG
jgi:GNAT superfamily N-acetyltransferase